MKTTLRKMGWTLAVAGMLLTGGTTTASAKEMISDTLNVYDQNHILQYGASVTTAEEDRNGSQQIYLLDVGNLADPGQWGNWTSVMKEDRSTMSDAFGVTLHGTIGSPNEYVLFFFSDTSYEPCYYQKHPDPGNWVYEHQLPGGWDGGIFDATKYLLPSLQAQGWTADFTSGGIVDVVPEPATVLLLGGGMGCLILLKKKGGRS